MQFPTIYLRLTKGRGPVATKTATCPDGVIEAIESIREDWIAIGTQFHPENEAASALDVRVFEEFLDLIREPVVPMLRIAA